MADFMKLREELGTVERNKVKDVLFSNLYDEMNLQNTILKLYSH